LLRENTKPVGRVLQEALNEESRFKFASQFDPPTKRKRDGRQANFFISEISHTEGTRGGGLEKDLWYKLPKGGGRGRFEHIHGRKSLKFQ